MDFLENFKDSTMTVSLELENNTSGKEVVRIAVLDTGIDTAQIIGASYLWTNATERSGKANESR